MNITNHPMKNEEKLTHMHDHAHFQKSFSWHLSGILEINRRGETWTKVLIFKGDPATVE